MSRLDYGTKYCHNSPSMEEAALQRSIISEINSVMYDKERLIQKITESIECTLLPSGKSGELTALGIDKKLEKLNSRFQKLLRGAAEEGVDDAYTIDFKRIVDEMAKLKEEKAQIESSMAQNV